MTNAQIVAGLAHIGRPEILKRFKPDSCIASTRVGIEVLKRFGITAEAIPVKVMVYNEPLWKRMTAGSFDGTFNDEDWSVGIGMGYDPRRRPEDGFNGHLVIKTEGLLVDLAIDQASRPEKGLPIESLVVPWPQTWGIRPFRFCLAGCYYDYSPSENGAYQDAPDWKESDRWTSTVDSVTSILVRHGARPVS